MTGEEERLERVLPLIKKYGAAVVAITNDETGISEDPDVRFAVAKRIVERAADHGIPREDIVVDPLLMPIGAMPTAGRQVFRILGRLRDELKVNSTCGASNVSFGLPHREGINGAYLRDGDGQRPDLGDHESARGRASATAVMAARRPPGQRPRRRPLDPDASRGTGRGRGRRAARRTADGRRLRPADATMAPEAEPLVIFTPSGRRGRFPTGTTVLDAARALGVDIDSVCGGRGICGRCQVEQSIGSFPKHGIESKAGAPVARSAPVEAEYRSTKGLDAGRRLSCTAHVRGDVVVDVPPESQVYRQVVRKGLELRDLHVDPVVRLHYVEVTKPELASPTGDLARLQEALANEWKLTDLAADLAVVRALQPALEKGNYAVTVAVHGGRDDHRGLARLPRPGLRHRDRRRVDDDRRPPREPCRRRRPRQPRGDEPADPLRRGPDEPGQLRDDASRGGGRDDGRASGPRSTG